MKKRSLVKRTPKRKRLSSKAMLNIDPPELCVEHAEHRDDVFTFGVKPYQQSESGTCLNFSYNHIYLLPGNTVRLRTAAKTMKHRFSPQEYRAIQKLVALFTELAAKPSPGEEDRPMLEYLKRNPVRK